MILLKIRLHSHRVQWFGVTAQKSPARNAVAYVVRMLEARLGMVVDTLGKLRMVISKEIEAEVLRLHYAEKWRKGTIAAQLRVHHSTVERILVQNGVSPAQLRMRPSITDAYVDFIKGVLKEHPRLNATRIFHMARERGYPGGVDWFRDIVSRYRPRVAEEARLHLSTLPGEQAQIDWASFGKIKVGNEERKLYAFVMVLSWSRQIFLRFFLNQATANFQRGHIAAFEFFGGRVPRKCLYDNCKVVVQERLGNAIVYNPDLLALAGHYHFQPIAVPPRSPEHIRTFDKKQRVEIQKHIDDLKEAKRASKRHAGLDRLRIAAPSCIEFFVEAGNRAQNLGRLTQELTGMLELYGAQELERGVKSALIAGRIHAAAVKHAIEHERGKRGLTHTPARLRFESNALANELTIVPNTLASYGELFSKDEE